LIRQCIPIPQKIYSITKRLRTSDEVEKYFPDFIAFIDCTEQSIPRPTDNKRMIFYSGKKKRYTVKNQFVANNSGFIIHKAGHKKGRRHDYDMYKKNHPVIPKDVVNVFDLGYHGIEKDFPEQKTSIPYRKKRNQELLQEEKETDKKHVKRRIVIEHTTCRLKKYKIMSEVLGTN
jgi:hypothetical protein